MPAGAPAAAPADTRLERPDLAAAPVSGAGPLAVDPEARTAPEAAELPAAVFAQTLPELEATPAPRTESGPAPSPRIASPQAEFAGTLPSSDPAPAAPALPAAPPLPAMALPDLPAAPSPAAASLSLEPPGPGSLELTLPADGAIASIALEDRPLDELLYALRDPEAREDLIEDLGGTKETEEAIRRALKWLADNQEKDGRWSQRKHGGEQNRDVAATALATLAFMGFGESHTKDCQYQDTLRRSVRWLAERAGENGDMRNGGDMYDHGIGAIALAEAYGLTRDPELEDVVERVTRFIVEAQNKQDGGWRYRPGERGDTSVYGWQVMALKSARLAGVEVPENCWNRAEGWLRKVGGGRDGGHYGYQDRSPKPALVAEGLFCRQILGMPTKPATMNASADYLKKHLPSERKPDFYLWYYGSLGLYQHQGPVWQEWNNRIKTALLFRQDREGKRRGSWDPAGQHGSRMGRVVTTALGALTLEVYYRYLPLYGIGPDLSRRAP